MQSFNSRWHLDGSVSSAHDQLADQPGRRKSNAGIHLRRPETAHLSHLDPGVSSVRIHLALAEAHGAQAAPHLAVGILFDSGDVLGMLAAITHRQRMATLAHCRQRGPGLTGRLDQGYRQYSIKSGGVSALAA